MMPPKLGILAGRGELPSRLVARCREQGRDLHVVAFKGQAEPHAFDGVPHDWVRLGAAGKAVRCLRAAAVEEVVMVGGIRRPSLAALRPDALGAKIIARGAATSLGDDGLLSAIVRILEEEGFRVLGLDDLMPETLATAGVYGRHQPDETARGDIDLGIAAAKAIGAADIGQAVVVQQGMVLAVEAAEGTDALLARSGGLRRDGPGGVLVKVKKPGQEARADLPTIGVATVEGAQAAGLRGIAVEAGGALVVDRAAVVAAADAAGLFVVGLTIDD